MPKNLKASATKTVKLLDHLEQFLNPERSIDRLEKAKRVCKEKGLDEKYAEGLAATMAIDEGLAIPGIIETLLAYIRSLEADHQVMREALERIDDIGGMLECVKGNDGNDCVTCISDKALSSLQVHDA